MFRWKTNQTIQYGERLEDVSAARGYSQGGILCSMLWNMSVDSIITRFNHLGFYGLGYNNDIIELI